MPKLTKIDLHPASDENTDKQIIELDARGSLCPGPVLSLKQEVDKLTTGQQIRITATDKGFMKDVTGWCEITGNRLVNLSTETNGEIIALIEKCNNETPEVTPTGKDLVLVVFSDEMDKAMAAFNIALGAYATGMNVTIFFTFYGLSLIRKENVHEKHSFMEKLVDEMLPENDKKLPLSKNNFLGLGRKMMERLMKDKNVPPVDFMIHMAKYDGIKFVACQMSMDILGITKEELIDNIEVGGVATMLERARYSNMNFFI
ncbi:MAG: DsrE/DsrF/DrsH-like family protein [Bacteroidales bacterium]